MDYEPLWVKVVTFDPDKDDDDNMISERTIDHNNHDSRVWLGRHSYWALRNGYGVETYPVDEDE